MVTPPSQEDRRAPTRYILQTLPPPQMIDIVTLPGNPPLPIYVRPVTHLTDEWKVTVTKFSRLHEGKFSWEPEPGSPAYERRLANAEARGLERKLHWNGSTCEAVTGKWSFLHKKRILDGAAFDMCLTKDVCKTCLYQFENA